MSLPDFEKMFGFEEPFIVRRPRWEGLDQTMPGPAQTGAEAGGVSQQQLEQMVIEAEKKVSIDPKATY